MTAQQSPQPNPNPDPAPPKKTATALPVGRGAIWAAGAFLLGAFLIYNSVDTSADAKPQSHHAPAATGHHTRPATDLTLPRSVPKRLTIPEIAVDAPFTPLTLAESGQLNPPPAGEKNLVGWYQDGASPGERGAAIVAGHVDTKTGPAVFLQLETLKPGATVEITREDGIVATFQVDSVETFSKASFPNDRVYADTPDAQLRLITCGGSYDRKVKDYMANVVAFAHLVSSKRA
ncbi:MULTISPECIES: class F sortase [Streptomyces]|uniref:class F sortase n=1 Tax=Streptomyces TaxID=1883 RepID=UPI0019669905|nr:class F sortase [Streptomyces noursei]QRX90303.1 class F sortase [Streptomyces noursei]UJB40214.1 class F sortase [Streptomyces sp. A1-5]